MEATIYPKKRNIIRSYKCLVPYQDTKLEKFMSDTELTNNSNSSPPYLPTHTSNMRLQKNGESPHPSPQKNVWGEGGAPEAKNSLWEGGLPK